MKKFILKSKVILTQIPNNNKTSVIIHSILLILCIVFYFFKLALTPVPSLEIYHLSLIGIIFINTVLLILKTLPVSFINNISLSCGYIYMLRANLAWGGIQSPYLVWAVFVVVCAAFFSKTKSYLVWVVLALAHPLFLYWLTPYFPSEVELHYRNNFMELANGSSLQALIILFSLTMISFSNEASKRYKKIYESKAVMAELVRILSYDIGGPTHTIKKMAGYLKQIYPGNDNEIKSLDKIINAALVIQTITARVQELKDLGESGKTFDLHYLDLNEVCEKVIPLFQEKAQKKGITIQFIPHFEHSPILGTKDILSFQIIPNILSNSIKFSDTGQTITIKVEPNKLIIIDQGIGIPKEMLSKIFSYENHTNRLGTQGEKGTGFGMPLVKTLLERMKAQIQIRSKDKKDYPNEHGTEIEINFKGRP